MARAKVITDLDGRFYGIRIDCQGCDSVGPLGHVLPVRWCPPGMVPSPHSANKPQWDFNGNLELPTLKPSILSRWEQHAGTEREIRRVCHSFVTDGRIQYLSDCTHAYAGQTMDLPEISE